MAKQIISESRLREIISEEAARFKKKLTLEAEKKKLLKRLNEMHMEEMMDEAQMEEDLDENILKAIGGAAKAVFAPEKVARETAEEWLKKQDKSLVDSAIAQDKASYEKLRKSFENYLRTPEPNGPGIGGSYTGLYLAPFFSTFGALGQADADSRGMKFKAQAPIKVGSNAE